MISRIFVNKRSIKRVNDGLIQTLYKSLYYRTNSKALGHNCVAAVLSCIHIILLLCHFKLVIMTFRIYTVSVCVCVCVCVCA